MEPRAYTLRTPDVAARMKADVMRLPVEPANPWRVMIERTDDTRTLAQNARYWAGVITACQRWIEQQEGRRLSKDRIHDWLKMEKYGMQIEIIRGKVQHVPKRTRDMGKREFAKFAEWAEAYVMTEWGVPAELIDGLHQESMT